jgi:hypothetical protein
MNNVLPHEPHQPDREIPSESGLLRLCSVLRRLLCCLAILPGYTTILLESKYRVRIGPRILDSPIGFVLKGNPNY